MKYIKSFNESSETCEVLFDTIRECFLEFEDDGWMWLKSQQHSGYQYSHSLKISGFLYVFTKEQSDKSINDIEYTGEIDQDGDITWFRKNSPVDFNKEEFMDFLVAIKRISDETRLKFVFSYNNTFGPRRIIINGVFPKRLN